MVIAMQDGMPATVEAIGQNGTCYTLKANQEPPMVAVAMDARHSDCVVHGERTGTLDTEGSTFAVASPLPEVAGPLHGMSKSSGWPTSGDVARGGFFLATPHFGVRRITPLEAERLQGFPDHWTQVEWRGKPMADSARYRMLGNAMAVNVMRWIGERIQMYERLMHARGPSDTS